MQNSHVKLNVQQCQNGTKGDAWHDISLTAQFLNSGCVDFSVECGLWYVL